MSYGQIYTKAISDQLKRNRFKKKTIFVQLCCALTEECRGRHGAIATRHHYTDPRFNEGHRKVDNLWPLLIDGEWTHGHVGFLCHNLRGNRRQADGQREGQADILEVCGHIQYWILEWMGRKQHDTNINNCYQVITCQVCKMLFW